MAFFSIYLLNQQVEDILTKFNHFIRPEIDLVTLNESVANSINDADDEEDPSDSVRICHITAWRSLVQDGSTWLEDFNKITEFNLNTNTNERTSAFLLINVKYSEADYLYAISWGEAFRFFEKICVKNFGLTVAKKTINHDEITGASVIGQFASARSASATSHRPSSIAALRMFEFEEKFIKISGKLDEESISTSRISGKNSLVISQPSDTNLLFSALRNITEIYVNKQLNPNLNILEHFTDVSDLELENTLHALQKAVNDGKFQLSFSEKLVKIMNSAAHTLILKFMSAGGSIKQLRLISFSSQEELYSKLNTFLKKNKSSLKKINEYIIESRNDPEIHFPLESTLNIFIEEDITDNGKSYTYTFSGSTWTKFSSEFNESVNEKLQHIKFYDHKRIVWDTKTVCCEAGFNEKFANKHDGLLIDAKLPKINGLKSSFELADIALEDEDTNRYIATKRVKDSSDISYLFNQGLVSSSGARKLIRNVKDSESEIKSFLTEESGWYRNNQFLHNSDKTTTFSYLVVIDPHKYGATPHDLYAIQREILTQLPIFYKTTILNTLEFHKNYEINMEISFIPYMDNGKMSRKEDLCRKCSVAGEQFKNSLENALLDTQVNVVDLKFMFNSEGKIKKNLETCQKTKIFILDLLESSKDYMSGPRTVVENLNKMSIKEIKNLSTNQAPIDFIRGLGLGRKKNISRKRWKNVK